MTSTRAWLVSETAAKMSNDCCEGWGLDEKLNTTKRQSAKCFIFMLHSSQVFKCPEKHECASQYQVLLNRHFKKHIANFKYCKSYCSKYPLSVSEDTDWESNQNKALVVCCVCQDRNELHCKKVIWDNVSHDTRFIKPAINQRLIKRLGHSWRDWAIAEN